MFTFTEGVNPVTGRITGVVWPCGLSKLELVLLVCADSSIEDNKTADEATPPTNALLIDFHIFKRMTNDKQVAKVCFYNALMLCWESST